MPKNRAPVAKLAPPEINGLTVIVDGSASEDPDGEIKRWRLTWGDSTHTSGSGHPGRAEHVYSESARYDIVLTVMDKQHVSASMTVAAVVVGTGPTPVDCQLSEWSAWAPAAGAAGQWSPCLNGSQHRTEERSRTVVVPPSGGGAACDPNQHETREATVACTAPPIPGQRAVVKPEDLKFIGFYRFAPEAGVLYWSDGAITMRTVGGKKRLLLHGDHTEGYPVMELAIPDTPPTLELPGSPFLSFVKNWGPLPAHLIPYNWGIGSIGWDADRSAVIHNIVDAYIPKQHHVNQLVSVLNDADGSVKHYGPWRTQWIAQQTCGGWTTVPEWFRQYVGGNKLAVSSFMTSGAAGCAWGASLSAMQFPPLESRPDDENDVNQKSVINYGIILHTLNTRQQRPDARFKGCDQRDGSLHPGTLDWGGGDPGSGTGDVMNNVMWIDLPDKHGLLYFGQLVTTPAGYVAPYDADGLVHMGYAALQGNPPVCVHGQDDPFFKSTGPWAHMRICHGWIYDPADLVATATGAAALHSRTPRHTFQLHTTIAPWMPVRNQAGCNGVGAVFDPETRRIYAPYFNDRLTHPPHTRPSVMVYEVQ